MIAAIAWWAMTIAGAIATLGLVTQTAPIAEVIAMAIVTMSYAALAYHAQINRL